MKQAAIRQNLYEAVVSLSDVRSFEETCRRILAHGCRVMDEKEGFLFVKQGQTGDNVQLEYKDGYFKMHESAQMRQFPSFKWGSPLYAPCTIPMGFLGVGFADGISRREALALHAFSRYAVVASWVLYYAFEPDLFWPQVDSFMPTVMHDCSFYVKQILHYNTDAAKAQALFAEAGASLARYPEADGQSPGVCLTGREIEVLLCLQAGCSNEAIAAKLCFSIATVKYHLGHIFKKLRVKNRTQAVVAARQAGFL